MGRSPSILVTGAGGQVGKALEPLLPEARFMNSRELDVTDETSVRREVAGCSVVVHLAALTDVDLCERDQELATRVNDVGTRHIAEAARDISARVVYISTDYVFDGDKRVPYKESDPPRPINHYGSTKLKGEHHVLANSRCLIIRTSGVVGEGKNFVNAVLATARRGSKLYVVTDQVGRPTFAVDLAAGIVRLINVRAEGLVHLSNSGPPCSRAELAREAVMLAGLDNDVIGVNTETHLKNKDLTVAPRPAYSVLDLERAETLGLEMPGWAVSLERYVQGQC